MDAHAADWIALLLRWLHVATAVVWAGTLLHHLRLDDHAHRGDGADPWLAQGGAFYRLTPQPGGAGVVPSRLLWVRWEAYLAWASGFLLLAIIYYRWAAQSLVDSSVLDISGGQATAIGLCLLAGAWIAYDQLCRSALRHRGQVLPILLGVLLAGLAWALPHIFSARGAFIHFGAILGTLMAANLAHHIVPAQRDVLRSPEARSADAERRARASERHAHNGYLVLPVLLTMVASHYTPALGPAASAFVLAAIAFGGMALRAFLARLGRGA